MQERNEPSFFPPEVPRHILDEMAARSALAHLDRPTLYALRDAGRGQPLTASQRDALGRGWNGSLLDVRTDRLTRLGETAYNIHSTGLAVPERQSPDVTSSERERMALDQQRKREYQEQQQGQQQQRQRQLQSRNIAQREETRDEVQAPRQIKARLPKRDRGLER